MNMNLRHLNVKWELWNVVKNCYYTAYLETIHTIYVKAFALIHVLVYVHKVQIISEHVFHSNSYPNTKSNCFEKS